MKIVIVGAGTTGYSLAEHLSGQNHNIAIIERDNLICDYVKSKLDAFVINGIGSSPALLEAAGIGSADMIIAVTSSDETNLLACHFAMQKGVKKRIARVKSDIYTSPSTISLDKLGVTNVIEPEREIVEKIIQYVDLPGVIETANFQGNNIYLRGYKITEDMPIANKTLSDVTIMAKGSPMLVVVIMREGKSIPPTGSQKLLPGDNIVVIMPKASFKTFRMLINRKVSKLKKIIVSGDSLTAIHLADALKRLSDQVLLVDPDREHGLLASSLLNGVDIYHGDCTNTEILQEINAEHADCFVAAGTDSEDNIMSCLLAKTAGADIVIAVRNDDRYLGLFNSLGIDHIINPYDITLNMIIEKIQMVPIGSYLKLKSADIEVLRFKAKKGSPVAGKSLRDLDDFLKKSVIIGCIIRNNEVIIPWGGIVIEEGDEVIILSRKEHINWVNKQFNSRFGVLQ